MENRSHTQCYRSKRIAQTLISLKACRLHCWNQSVSAFKHTTNSQHSFGAKKSPINQAFCCVFNFGGRWRPFAQKHTTVLAYSQTTNHGHLGLAGGIERWTLFEFRFWKSVVIACRWQWNTAPCSQQSQQQQNISTNAHYHPPILSRQLHTSRPASA